MEKLKVSKEVFEGLNNVLTHYKKDTLLALHGKNISNKKSWHFKDYLFLDEMSIKELAIALYIGYELEETKEDIIYKIFKINKSLDNQKCNSFCEGIKYTLDTLNIKIEGIN